MRILITKYRGILCLLLLATCVLVAFKSENEEDSPKEIPSLSGLVSQIHLERITTIAPFPRGLDMVDGKLYVLCRGRVRGSGGVSAEVEDQAGTIYVVNPNLSEPFHKGEPSNKIKENGKVFALPTSPPFRLWDRQSDPPENDRLTDRPYCTLRYHDATKSFYVCAFSGIDKAKVAGQAAFSKNLTDAVFRYDTRTGKWYEVERHNVEAGGSYPHTDPQNSVLPHGWLNGPDNCLAVGNYLYAVGKDNSILVRYDLNDLTGNAEAGYPKGEFVLGEKIFIKGRGMINFYGHSTLAVYKNYLYIGSRTSSLIVRMRINETGMTVNPSESELVANFEPYNPQTGATADITDMTFDSKGRLYVISAMPARIFRFTPDPKNVYDATNNRATPWADLATITDNPSMKGENIFIDKQDRLFITSGDGYSYQAGADGTVYRIVIEG